MLRLQDPCTPQQRRAERIAIRQGKPPSLPEPPGIKKHNFIDKIIYRSSQYFSENGKVAHVKPNGNVHIYTSDCCCFMIINQYGIKLRKLYNIRYYYLLFVNKFCRTLNLNFSLKIKNNQIFLKLSDTLHYIPYTHCAIVHNIKPMFAFPLKNKTFSQLFRHEKLKRLKLWFPSLDDLCLENINRFT